MKTTAAILEKLKAPLVLEELIIPSLKEGQVLVELRYSGICHTQLNEIKGLKGEDPYLPHTLGHEGSGIVLEVGPKVTKVKAGDPVVLSWIKGSGINASGTIYQGKGRSINSGPISTFMQHAVIAENRINKIPEGVSLKEAALLGCAFPTGAGAVFHQMKLQKNQSLAIFGVGGIGLSAVLAAKQRGAGKIIAVDIQSNKLEKAKQLGATHTILASKEGSNEAIQAITEGKGVDFSLECAGKKSSMEAAFAAVRVSGGLCIVAGNLPKGDTISIDPFALIAGKQIIGSWGGGSCIDQDIDTYTQLIQEKKLSLVGLIHREAPLKAINELFGDLERGILGRGMVQF